MSTIIKVKCTDQVLTFENTPVIASGGLGEDFVSFEFCSKWDGLAKTAVFWRTEADAYHAVLDESGGCAIPPEVLTQEGVIYFGVFGVDSEGNQRTSDVLRYTVVKGVITEGTKPSDPTQDIYTQLLANYAEVLAELARAEGVAVEAAEAAQAAQQAAEAAAASAGAIESVANSAAEVANAAGEAAANAVKTANDAANKAENHASQHKTGGSDPLTAADVGAMQGSLGIVSDADLFAWADAQSVGGSFVVDKSVTTTNVPNSPSEWFKGLIDWAPGGTRMILTALSTDCSDSGLTYTSVKAGGIWQKWVGPLATTDYALPRDGSAAMTGALSVSNGLVKLWGDDTAVILEGIYSKIRHGFVSYLNQAENERFKVFFEKDSELTEYAILHAGNIETSGVAKIASGTYTGTGVAGNEISKATVITFPFVPKLVVVAKKDAGDEFMLLINGCTEAAYPKYSINTSGNLIHNIASVSWSDNSVYLLGGKAQYQMNEEDKTYNWVAFG